MKLYLDQFYAFLSRPLSGRTRVALALLVIPLALSLTQPLWRISMEAAQYPAGLYMDVYAYKVEGGNGGQHLQEINTLNHYIGMHPLDEAAFADTAWIPFALGVLILFTLRIAAIGNVRGLVDLVVMTSYVSAFAFGRFVYMLYTFGHHLSPTAPVKVKPFMPAVLGSKRIANFTVHSLPQMGSLLLGIFAVGLFALFAWQLLAGRRQAVKRATSALAVAAAVLVAVLWAPPASACAACNTGDPTLTAMGEEQPTVWRTRASTFLRVWGRQSEEQVAGHVHTSQLREARLDVSASVAPADWLVLALTVPVQARQSVEGHGEVMRFVSPGDVDVGARAVLWRDRRFAPGHLLSAVVGVELPTSPLKRDALGEPLELHDQVGSGSVDPRVGLTYSFFRSAWSAQAGLVTQWPTRGYEGYRVGPMARGFASVQYQAVPWLGVRLGVEGRLETQDVQRGTPVAGTGGAVGYAVPALLVAASQRVALQAVVHVPVVASGRTAGELPTLGVGALFDF